jgi:hypothetical protein
MRNCAFKSLMVCLNHESDALAAVLTSRCALDVTSAA